MRIGHTEAVSPVNESFLETLSTASEAAYKASVVTTARAVHRQQQCGRVTGFMVNRLQADYPATWTMWREIGIEEEVMSRLNYRKREAHAFGVTDELGDRLVFDGTWQQFRPGASAWSRILGRRETAERGLPRVIVGRPVDFVQAVGHYGVHDFALEFWQPDAIQNARLTRR